LTPDELHAALRNTGALAKAGMAADIDPHVLEVRFWSPLERFQMLQEGSMCACKLCIECLGHTRRRTAAAV
jgi:hypothetical protein